MFSLNKFKKRYLIKIPESVKILYCDKKNIIVFKGISQTKSLQLPVRIFLTSKSDMIAVTDLPTLEISNSSVKSLKEIQGTTTAKIKQMLIETTYTLYHKLNLVGVGYRVFSYEQAENQLYFKLGYSHLIYFRVPSPLKTRCQKFTKLFVFGISSFDNLTQTAAQIRACKRPEPYKGKGILYNQEKVMLKKGKKI